MKIYDKNGDIGYFIESDVQYPERLHELEDDLHFLPENWKLKKLKKLVANLHNKEEYVMYTKNLKQALHHK